MAEKESTNPLFSKPLESYPGLTVADLNQYLPALQKTDDIEMTLDTMHDGVFLTDGLEGLRKLPAASICLLYTSDAADE